MKNNVVIALFEVESEAFQAFNGLCRAAVGEDYMVPEAALIQRKANSIEVLDSFGVDRAGDGALAGILIGSLVGIIGGPVGVLLGATEGAWAGSLADVAITADSASAVAVVASKINEGETAIAALVREEEPAFDAVFDNYKTTIIRYDAADIADDVDRLYELEAELDNLVRAEIKKERKAERAEQRKERDAIMSAQIEQNAAENSKMFNDMMYGKE